MTGGRVGLLTVRGEWCLCELCGRWGRRRFVFALGRGGELVTVCRDGWACRARRRYARLRYRPP